jgi:hypothetical protein
MVWSVRGPIPGSSNVFFDCTLTSRSAWVPHSPLHNTCTGLLLRRPKCEAYYWHPYSSKLRIIRALSLLSYRPQSVGIHGTQDTMVSSYHVCRLLQTASWHYNAGYHCMLCVFLFDCKNYLVLIFVYVPHCVLCLIVLFCVLFMCKCVLCRCIVCNGCV